ncbi:MAG TPA: hypothetical protein VFT75_18255 [Nocardioidaceae bacterium]|nr:hypothetical protein [Nocardioidaceae bacterium]
MRQDQWSNTLSARIGSKNVDLGVWDTLSGGDVAFSETKYSPGGMQPQKSLGGTKSVNNITLGKLLDVDDQDDWALIRTLMQLTEEADCTVARQPLGTDKRPFGTPLVYTGKMIAVAPGDTDSNAEGAQVWTVTVSTNANVS